MKRFIQHVFPSCSSHPPFLSLIISAGDLIQRWTNDIWHSPLHRVVTSRAATGEPPHQLITPTTSATTTTTASTSSSLQQQGDDSLASTTASISSAAASQLSRQAIVFFTGPLEDCVIEGLDPQEMRNVDVTGMRERYPPMRAGDHLLMKIKKTNLSS